MKKVNLKTGSILLIVVVFFCFYGMLSTINTTTNSDRSSSYKIIQDGNTNNIQHKSIIFTNTTPDYLCNSPCDGPW